MKHGRIPFKKTLTTSFLIVGSFFPSVYAGDINFTSENTQSSSELLFTSSTVSNPMSFDGGEDDIVDGGGNFRPAPPISKPFSTSSNSSLVFPKKTPFGVGTSVTLRDRRKVGNNISNPDSYTWRKTSDEGASSLPNSISAPQNSAPTSQTNFSAGTDQSGPIPSPSGQAGGTGNDDGLYIIPDHKGENVDAAIDDILDNTNAPSRAIRKAKEAADANRRAMARPARLPKHVSRSLHLTLLNGEERPVIHLMRGNMTTIVFHDLTGAGWPYHADAYDGESYVKVGGSSASSNSSSSDGKGTVRSNNTNILCLQPKVSYSAGTNAQIFLDGIDIPVIFQMDTGYSGQVDDFIDVTIAKRGPQASASYITTGLTPDHDNFLQPFVDGVPPQNAHRLQTSNEGVEAWLYGKKMIVRTSYPLESGYLARSDQVGGAVAYALNPHLNFITIAVDGVITSVEIQH